MTAPWETRALLIGYARWHPPLRRCQKIILRNLMRKITNNRRDHLSHPFVVSGCRWGRKARRKKAAPWCRWERYYSNTIILRLQRINRWIRYFIRAVWASFTSRKSLVPAWEKKRDTMTHTQTLTRICQVRLPIFRINRNLDWMKCEGWSGTLRHTYCAGTLEPSWLATSKSAWVSEWARLDLICMRSTLALRTFAAEQRELHYKLKAASLNGIHAFWHLLVRLPFFSHWNGRW